MCAGMFSNEVNILIFEKRCEIPSILRELLPIETQGQEIFITSDSDSMIKALVSPVTTSNLIRKMKDYLNQWV